MFTLVKTGNRPLLEAKNYENPTHMKYHTELGLYFKCTFNYYSLPIYNKTTA